MSKPYNSLSDHLKARFGCKVFKVTVNTGLSCPNRDGSRGHGGCIYCDSSVLLPKEVTASDVGTQILRGIEYVRKRHKAEKFIAYFQINTNTYAPIEALEKFYSEAMLPEVAAIAVSTRPDCVGDDVLDLLAGINAKKPLWLELGLQTCDDATLVRINRGHTSAEFADAVKRAKSRSIDVCAHVMIGLPGEGQLHNLRTMYFLAKLGIWGVKFHQLQVLKGTALEKLWEKGEVVVQTLEEYSDTVVKCIERLPRDMVVHRVSGDAPRKYLVAPVWGVNKFRIIEAINETFLRRDTFQGAACMPTGKRV